MPSPMGGCGHGPTFGNNRNYLDLNTTEEQDKDLENYTSNFEI
jgi:hypothetical protein